MAGITALALAMSCHSGFRRCSGSARGSPDLPDCSEKAQCGDDGTRCASDSNNIPPPLRKKTGIAAETFSLRLRLGATCFSRACSKWRVSA